MPSCAVVEPLAQRRVGIEEALAECQQRILDIGAKVVARGGARAHSGLAPPLQRAIAGWSALRAEAAGVDQQPERGEIGKHLVMEDRAEVCLDIGRAGQAGVVAHQPDAVSRENQPPVEIGVGVEPVLQEHRRRAPGDAAIGTVAELGLGAGEAFAELALFANDRGGDHDGHAAALCLPCDAEAAAFALMGDGTGQTEPERFFEQRFERMPLSA